MTDLTDAVLAIREARPAYERAMAYYRGEVAEVFASPAIRRKLEATGQAYRINLAARPVDAVLERLNLTSVTAEESEVAAWLAAQWRRNDMAAEIADLHRDAEVYGDAYLTVWPGDVEGDVDLFHNSPLGTRVFYDDENPRLRRYAAKLWLPAGGRLRATLYYPDRIERWVLVERPKKGGEVEADWEAYGDESEQQVEHGLGEVPVFHFRTERPYGVPEHRDAYGPQDAITKLVVSMMASTDFQGFPQRYAISGAADAVEGDEDEFADERAPSAARSNLRAGPGELWWLRGVDEVGQFDAANVDAFLRPTTAMTRYMAATTATPVHYVEPTGDAPSGESLRAAEAPLTARVARRQGQFGSAHMSSWRCALRAGGRGGDVEIGLSWAPIQTIDDLAGWQAVSAKVTAGVPTRQALLEAGYTTEQVESWGYLDNNELKPKVDLLAKLGEAVQSLGAGVALGVVSAEQVHDLIGELIGGEDD